MTIIIGFTGKKRSGKDSVSKVIQELHPDHVSVYSFADPLKKAVCNLFSIQITEENKESPLPFWDNVSPRYLLQRTGDKVKELFPDIFIRSMYSNIQNEMNKIQKQEKEHIILITDIRFNNEAEFVHSLGGFIIEINADKRLSNTTDDDTHCSEKGIDQDHIDCVVYNNESFEYTKKEIIEMFKY
jgi:hypothetical protein